MKSSASRTAETSRHLTQGVEYGTRRGGSLAGLLDFAGADAGRADSQRPVSALDDRTHGAQIGVPAALRDVVRVADPISVHRSLSTDVTSTSHTRTPSDAEEFVEQNPIIPRGSAFRAFLCKLAVNLPSQRATMSI